jgi:hypothetical protein
LETGRTAPWWVRDFQSVRRPAERAHRVRDRAL